MGPPDENVIRAPHLGVLCPRVAISSLGLRKAHSTPERHPEEIWCQFPLSYFWSPFLVAEMHWFLLMVCLFFLQVFSVAGVPKPYYFEGGTTTTCMMTSTGNNKC